jgi:hypothetical protein
MCRRPEHDDAPDAPDDAPDAPPLLPVDFFEALHYLVVWVPHERHELFYARDGGPYGALHHRLYKAPAAPLPAALARSACGRAGCARGHRPLQPLEVIWCESVDNRALRPAQPRPSGTWWYHVECASGLQRLRSLVVAASRALPMPSHAPLDLAGSCPARAAHDRLWALDRHALRAEGFAHLDGYYGELAASDRLRIDAAAVGRRLARAGARGGRRWRRPRRAARAARDGRVGCSRAREELHD